MTTPIRALANGSAATGPVLQATQSVPIVFAIVPDPVGAGYVANLARPGGNGTGFLSFEFGIAAKWLELFCQRSLGWKVRAYALNRMEAKYLRLCRFYFSTLI